jgi:hypothetical protein
MSTRGVCPTAAEPSGIRNLAPLTSRPQPRAAPLRPATLRRSTATSRHCVASPLPDSGLHRAHPHPFLLLFVVVCTLQSSLVRGSVFSVYTGTEPKGSDTEYLGTRSSEEPIGAQFFGNRIRRSTEEPNGSVVPNATVKTV